MVYTPPTKDSHGSRSCS
jgi:hypothetical protein